MIKNILTDISGIGLFPIISLLLFFVVFIAVLIHVVRMDPRVASRLSALPLDTTSENETRGGHNRA